MRSFFAFLFFSGMMLYYDVLTVGVYGIENNCATSEFASGNNVSLQGSWTVFSACSISTSVMLMTGAQDLLYAAGMLGFLFFSISFCPPHRPTNCELYKYTPFDFNSRQTHTREVVAVGSHMCVDVDMW